MVDKAKLEKAAGKGVAFTDEQVEDLLLQIGVCDEEWQQVYSLEVVRRYKKLKKLEREAEELGARLVSKELAFGWDEPGLWRRYVLGMNADRIEEIWRAAGGTGKPGWNDKYGGWSGPITRLMIELYRQADISEERWPGVSAIRDGMRLYATG